MKKQPISRLSSFFQHTLKDSFVVIGRGLHSGQRVVMTVMPGDTDTGYCFVRKDIKHKNNEIYALWHNVSDTFLSTTISNASGTRVSTIEHLVAALHACGVDNARIVINGPEVPIVDGSSLPFVQLIQSVGLERQDEDRFVYALKRPIEIRDGHKFIVLQPADTCEYTVSIDFSSEAIGKQSFSLELTEDSFQRDIASARTFGFNEDVHMLREMGMVKGGSLNNAVVVQGDNIINREGLRYDDEFVRHKVLDCIGDLALAGDPILAKVDANCTGHRLNNAVLLEMMRNGNNYELMPLRMWHQRREDFRQVSGPKNASPYYNFGQETLLGNH